jgi:foldase protein PrsA
MSHAPRILTSLLALSLGAAIAGCSGGSSGTVATVNGEAISRADFENRLESGPQAKQILSQMIQTKLLDQYATENHIDVPAADIAKKEADIKAKYPPGQFEALLKQQNLTEDDVQKILKEQIVLQKAVDKDVKVSDSDISAYFQKNHAQFDKPEQAHAKHILVADLKTADLVESKLKAGGKFEDLAKQYSTDPGTKDKGGDLGFFGTGVPRCRIFATARRRRTSREIAVRVSHHRSDRTQAGYEGDPREHARSN